MNGLTTYENCGDLAIEGGGCIVAGTEAQSDRNTFLWLNRGEWREHPLLGRRSAGCSTALPGGCGAARARQMCREAGGGREPGNGE